MIQLAHTGIYIEVTSLHIGKEIQGKFICVYRKVKSKPLKHNCISCGTQAEQTS